MALDKIFIDEDLIVFHCLTDRHDLDLEYIRKDALLDFLKKKVNEIEIAMETGADDPVLWGQRNAFKQVIDKLNSM